MPDDGSSKKDEGGRGGSLVERAMLGVRRSRKPRQAAAADSTIAASAPAEPSRNPVVPVSTTSPEAAAKDIPGATPSVSGTADNLAQVQAAGAEPVIPPAAGGERDPASDNSGAEIVARAAADRAVAQRSHSRSVDLDFERLQKLGFITPNRARSQTTEEFRLIKRSLLQGVSSARSDGERNANLIMVTSAGPSEGKTFNAINLAISIASEPDLNALLIDADLVNPSVFRTLGIEPGRGLVDVIETGDFNLADVLIRTNIGGLTMLDAGTPHPMATELLASERMHRFVDDVATRYPDRIVIFDAPPILATSEASVLTGHMSQIVFVVEADRTSRSQAKEALDMIGAGPRVGLVLNKASARFGARQFGAYYKPYSKE